MQYDYYGVSCTQTPSGRPTTARSALALLLCLTSQLACSPATSSRRLYAHHKSEPPLTISWNYVRPRPGVIVAEGIAHNDLSRKFHFLDVTARLFGLDREGRVLSRAHLRVPDFIGSDTRFRIPLTLQGTEERFDLRFEYHVEDIETDGGRK